LRRDKETQGSRSFIGICWREWLCTWHATPIWLFPQRKTLLW
jgi:hypothetical protein